MFKSLWSTVVALGVLVSIASGLLAIVGTDATVQILAITGLVLLFLLLFRIASPRGAGIVLTNEVTLSLGDRGKTAQSRSVFTYVPLRAGFSHQVWHVSPSSVSKVTCELQGVQVSVTEPSVEGSCVVNFGSQLRRLRRYDIKRQTNYKDDQFSAESEFFYFRSQAPTCRLVVQIEFPSGSNVAAVSRSVRIGMDHLDRGPQKVENQVAKWTVWFPSVGTEYWMRWTWT